MSIRQTPYPKSSFSAYLITLSGISLSIVFILTVFQPFGTTNFSHPHKYLLLSGYGLVILLVGTIYYGVTSLLISSSRLDRWTVLDEVAFLFVNISFCQVGCFFYWAFWFSDGITWEQFFVFFRLASTVTLIPMSVYLFFIYQKYKEVNFIHSKNVADNNDQILEPLDILTIEGNGKNEKLNLKIQDLFLVKSEDNYVILYVAENEKISKKILRNTLTEIEQQLGEYFFRCHRSYILNPSKIKLIEGNITNTKITLENIDHKIPVSRTLVEKTKQLQFR